MSHPLNSRWANAVTVALVALVTGCQTPSGPTFDPRASNAVPLANLEPAGLTNAIKPEWLIAPTNTYVLGPGDVVEISQADNPATRTVTRIGPDGKIYFQYLPGLDIWGMTLAEARAALEEELAKTITRPEVFLSLQTPGSKRIWLLGRFGNPGIYPIVAPLRLLEAIAMGGGPAFSSGLTTQDLADLQHAFILRNGEFVGVDFVRLINEGDMSQNIYLQPDDFVYIPSSLANQVYVLGGVRSPGGIPYVGQVTLFSAITKRGGPASMAYQSHVTILRGSLTQPMITVVNFRDIQLGRVPDVILEPRDIVYVPLTPFRKVYEYAELAVRTFVGSLASNYGARVAGGSGFPGGGYGGYGGLPPR
jgi:protein involved in polysaccharide export with SLBB domain